MYPDSKEYHHIGCLRNQHGEFMGDEITHVVLELDKWNKQVDDIESDLDKLIYVMKATHELNVVDKFVAPQFWSEEWIQSALKDELKRENTEMERQNAEMERENAEMEREKETILTTAITNFLEEGKDINTIAEMFSISVEKILAIQEKMNRN